jgi:hypothetical protein
VAARKDGLTVQPTSVSTLDEAYGIADATTAIAVAAGDRVIGAGIMITVLLLPDDHVGLTRPPGRALQLRGCRDLALEPLPHQVPGQTEPRRTGLIGDRDRTRQRPDPRLDVARSGVNRRSNSSPVRPSKPHPTTERACTSDRHS